MDTERLRESKDEGLSYSSAGILLECQQKYHYKKIENLPYDPDYEDNFDSLNIGKAFHEVLEVTSHLEFVGKYTPDVVKQACEHQNCIEDLPLVTAMCEVYGKMHRASKLKVHRAELKIAEDKKFIGFIDAVMYDEKNGGWWIVDNKTSATFSPAILSRLTKDPQLNLYAYYAVEKGVGNIIGVKGKFLGVRYRITTKSRAERNEKKGETVEAFIKRLTNLVKSYDVEIPVAVINPKEAWSEHMALLDLANSFKQGVAPTRNYRACVDKYNKQCPWWSRCYGKTFTECKSLINIYDADSYDATLEDLI